MNDTQPQHTAHLPKAVEKAIEKVEQEVKAVEDKVHYIEHKDGQK